MGLLDVLKGKPKNKSKEAKTKEKKDKEKKGKQRSREPSASNEPTSGNVNDKKTNGSDKKGNSNDKKMNGSDKKGNSNDKKMNGSDKTKSVKASPSSTMKGRQGGSSKGGSTKLKASNATNADAFNAITNFGKESSPATDKMQASVQGSVTRKIDSPSNEANSPAEPWQGEEMAKKFVNRANFSQVKAEFAQYHAMPVDVPNRCKIWSAHRPLNQSDAHPTLDSHIFKCPDAKDYVNVSKVNVPLPRSVYLGQFPKAGTEETFWKAIYELRATSIHILTDEEITFFPLRDQDFMHYGTMFVNNRRVDVPNGDVTRYSIEVLPAGFSNSIISTITVVRNWKVESVHVKHSLVVKEVNELTSFLTSALPDENALILSKNGAGRAGYFLALTVAIAKMAANLEPNLFEIVKDIRQQRPTAVEALVQYAALYIALFYYIRRKLNRGGDSLVEKKKGGSMESGNATSKKAKELADTFHAELRREIDLGNCGRSVKEGITRDK